MLRTFTIEYYLSPISFDYFFKTQIILIALLQIPCTRFVNEEIMAHWQHGCLFYLAFFYCSGCTDQSDDYKIYSWIWNIWTDSCTWGELGSCLYSTSGAFLARWTAPCIVIQVSIKKGDDCDISNHSELKTIIFKCFALDSEITLLKK